MNRNAVDGLIVIEDGIFTIVNANIVQCDSADRAVRLERESVQFAAGLYLIDPGALPFKHGHGIRRSDQHILEDNASGKDLRFVKRKTVQLAACVHSNVFKGFPEYHVSAGFHLDIRRMSAVFDMQHSFGTDRSTVQHAAEIYIVLASIEKRIGYHAAVVDMDLSVSSERNSVRNPAIGNIKHT